MRMYKLSINNSDYDVVIKEVTSEEVTAEVNGEVKSVRIRDIQDLTTPSAPVPLKPEAPSQAVQPAATTPAASSGSSAPAKKSSAVGAITAPIPGQIISVNVTVGDKVLKGQKVLVLEAMKLENVITSVHDGVVEKILVREGDIVDQNQELLIVA